MTRLERGVLGIGAAAIPSVLVAVWFVPSGSFNLALAVPLAGMALGAAMALWRVPPFPWLEAKLSKRADE
jgi:hypothetical protein